MKCVRLTESQKNFRSSEAVLNREAKDEEYVNVFWSTYSWFCNDPNSRRFWSVWM